MKDICIHSEVRGRVCLFVCAVAYVSTVLPADRRGRRGEEAKEEALTPIAWASFEMGGAWQPVATPTSRSLQKWSILGSKHRRDQTL